TGSTARSSREATTTCASSFFDASVAARSMARTARSAEGTTTLGLDDDDDMALSLGGGPSSMPAAPVGGERGASRARAEQSPERRGPARIVRHQEPEVDRVDQPVREERPDERPRDAKERAEREADERREDPPGEPRAPAQLVHPAEHDAREHDADRRDERAAE